MLTAHGFDLPLPGGGVLHAVDTGPCGRPDELAVVWHGGTPNTGVPPEPLFAAAERLGIRFLGADRPGYGGSSRRPRAPLAAIAEDVARVADAAGVGRFATLGHSGGGPRSLATAALLPDRAIAAVAISAPAPPGAAGLDRFRGMAPGVVREQAAVVRGEQAITEELERDEFDESVFTAEDFQALDGAWAWFGPVVRDAVSHGVAGQVDDLLTQAAPWGFEPGDVAVPVLVVHGTADRVVPVAHGRWLAEHLPDAALRAVPGAGHLSVLTEAPGALAWLRAMADRD